MSTYSLSVAQAYGLSLPAFSSLDDARSALFAERDQRIARLKGWSSYSHEFLADDSPASLKGMEAWYFRLFESDGFRALGVDREEFERCMAMYYCHVAVTNCPAAKWIVQEFAFQSGRYEIGVEIGAGRLMRRSFPNHYALPNNRRRVAIFRQYQKYFVPSKKKPNKAPEPTTTSVTSPAAQEPRQP